MSAEIFEGQVKSHMISLWKSLSAEPNLTWDQTLAFSLLFYTENCCCSVCTLSCQPLLKNCLSSILVYNAMHWKFYFVLRACKFKYILDYDLSQGSIHLSAESSSWEARQHLPTRSTLSTRIIPLTMWTFLRTGRCHWVTAADSLAPVPPQTGLDSTSGMRGDNRLTRAGYCPGRCDNALWSCNCLSPKHLRIEERDKICQVCRLAFVWFNTILPPVTGLDSLKLLPPMRPLPVQGQELLCHPKKK